jgi:hypothetical protein
MPSSFTICFRLDEGLVSVMVVEGWNDLNVLDLVWSTTVGDYELPCDVLYLARGRCYGKFCRKATCRTCFLERYVFVSLHWPTRTGQLKGRSIGGEGGIKVVQLVSLVGSCSTQTLPTRYTTFAYTTTVRCSCCVCAYTSLYTLHDLSL